MRPPLLLYIQVKSIDTKTNRITVLDSHAIPTWYWGPVKYIRFKGRCQIAHITPNTTLETRAE